MTFINDCINLRRQSANGRKTCSLRNAGRFDFRNVQGWNVLGANRVDQAGCEWAKCPWGETSWYLGYVLVGTTVVASLAWIKPRSSVEFLRPPDFCGGFSASQNCFRRSIPGSTSAVSIQAYRNLTNSPKLEAVCKLVRGFFKHNIYF